MKAIHVVKKVHIRPDMACASVLFGLSCLIGYEFTKNGNWDFMFQCPLAAIGIFAVSTIGFYLAGELLVMSLLKLKIRQVRKTRKNETLLIAFLILLCWAPHIILFILVRLLMILFHSLDSTQDKPFGRMLIRRFQL